MNIPIVNISRAIKKAILIDEYIYLLILRDQCEYLFDNNIPVKKDMLLSNGYIRDDKITEKGLKLLEEIEGMSNKIDSKLDFTKLHKELQDCLIKHYGKKNVKGFGDVYFLPSSTELTDSLKRFWKHFPEMKDIPKITKILKNHIEICSKKNKFAPALRYYIIKMLNSGINSPLANAYDNFEEEEQKQYNETKELQPKNIKNLF